MKRIRPVNLALVVFALLVSANSQTPQSTQSTSSVTVRQTARATIPLRSIQVNARTIAALPSGKKYVVDLTQRGVVYEFNSQTSQIDFSRVVVRTAKGEVAIESFLKSTFLKVKLVGFTFGSQSFSLRTRATGTFQSPPPATTPPSKIECGRFTCICEGADDCLDLALKSGRCASRTDVFFCWKYNEEIFCSCLRE